MATLIDVSEVSRVVIELGVGLTFNVVVVRLDWEVEDVMVDVARLFSWFIWFICIISLYYNKIHFVRRQILY